MFEQREPLRLEERYHPGLTKLTAQLLLFFVFTGGVLLILGPARVGGSVMKLVRPLMIASLPLTLVILLRCLICKLRMDENGVEAHPPLGSSAYLRWEEIHTAAIVVLTVNGAASDPMILLATPEPQEVLTRDALLHSRNLAKHEQIRIPDSPKRREIVEHYLHMELPVIRM